jgi:hypothetical protein
VSALFEHDSGPPELSAAELNQKIEAANGEVARLMAQRDQRIAEEQAEAAERAELEKRRSWPSLRPPRRPPRRPPPRSPRSRPISARARSRARRTGARRRIRWRPPSG